MLSLHEILVTCVKKKCCLHSNLSIILHSSWEINFEALASFTVNKWSTEWDNSRRWNIKKSYLHNIRETQCNITSLESHNFESEAAKFSCILLPCVVTSTAVHLSWLWCCAHCLFPLACDHSAMVSLVRVLGLQKQTAQGGRCLAFLWMPSINSWQMSGLLLDGNTSSCYSVLPPRPTGHTSLLGRRSIQPHCTSPIPCCHTYSKHTHNYTHISLYPSVKGYYIRQPSYWQATDHMLMCPDASTLEI